MFLQIMQGKLRDQQLHEQLLDEWRAAIKPGATGYLGSTSGVTADGDAIAVIRFASEDEARANAHRPEQDAWWQKMSQNFDGDVSFTDCSEVDTFLAGGSDDAGFVQIMRGRAVDPANMRESASHMEDELAKARPDLLGGVVGWHGDREFTQVAYFISEEAARKGETESQGDAGADEWAAMIDGEMTFVDLREPQFDSA